MLATQRSATPRSRSITSARVRRVESAARGEGVKCLHAHYAAYLAGFDDPVGRWVAAELERVVPSLVTPVAVVDCGTNSTRLLVKAGSVVLERRMVATRLGRSAGRTGRLDPEGVTRTLEVLGEYRDLIEAHGARRVRAVATQAVRAAADGDEFVDRASEVLGVRVEVLTGDGGGTARVPRCDE